MGTMKVVFIKVYDPVEYKKPDAAFYDEDMDWIKRLEILRIAGILIREDDQTITLGEIHCKDDNPELQEAGCIYPRYRYLITIAKTNIMNRQDFEIKE